VLKRSMDEGALATVEREERGIDHESLPYETI